MSLIKNRQHEEAIWRRDEGRQAFSAVTQQAIRFLKKEVLRKYGALSGTKTFFAEVFGADCCRS